MSVFFLLPTSAALSTPAASFLEDDRTHILKQVITRKVGRSPITTYKMIRLAKRYLLEEKEETKRKIRVSH